MINQLTPALARTLIEEWATPAARTRVGTRLGPFSRLSRQTGLASMRTYVR
jgi:hypothetical protein